VLPLGVEQGDYTYYNGSIWVLGRTEVILGAYANTSVGNNGVAIGNSAGYTGQGNYAIAIGCGAGYSNQYSNSIILNASGFNLNNSNSGFYVNPIRSNSSSYSVYYNPTSKEISYGSISSGAAGPQGPAGPTGPQGPAGVTGATGPIGPAGQNGTNGIAGPQGLQGVTGPQGLNGANGVNGTGLRYGSGTPASNSGILGDFYLDTTGNKIYGPKATNGWPTTGVSIVGPQGASGVNGTNGVFVPSTILTNSAFLSSLATNTTFIQSLSTNSVFLTALKQPQTITFGMPLTNSYVSNGILPLTGISSSGLMISYTSSNPNVLSIAGSIAIMKTKGSCTITASQQGNVQYSAASSKSLSITLQ
jgi:hypothetical protein